MEGYILARKSDGFVAGSCDTPIAEKGYETISLKDQVFTSEVPATHKELCGGNFRGGKGARLFVGRGKNIKVKRRDALDKIRKNMSSLKSFDDYTTVEKKAIFGIGGTPTNGELGIS